MIDFFEITKSCFTVKYIRERGVLNIVRFHSFVKLIEISPLTLQSSQILSDIRSKVDEAVLEENSSHNAEQSGNW